MFRKGLGRGEVREGLTGDVGLVSEVAGCCCCGRMWSGAQQEGGCGDRGLDSVAHPFR